MPSLGVHVPWEGFGERAILMMLDRWPGLRHVISQPERMKLVVNGKTVTYTPDYEVVLAEPPVEVLEIKGHTQLQDEKVQWKLAAAELEVARSGRRFRVFNSRELTSSVELRNIQLLRRYARYPVTAEQSASLRSPFRVHAEISLGALVDAAEQHGLGREQVYALLYRSELSMDWTHLVCNTSRIWLGVELAHL